jgi:hypothetical protein
MRRLILMRMRTSRPSFAAPCWNRWPGQGLPLRRRGPGNDMRDESDVKRAGVTADTRLNRSNEWAAPRAAGFFVYAA